MSQIFEFLNYFGLRALMDTVHVQRVLTYSCLFIICLAQFILFYKLHYSHSAKLRKNLCTSHRKLIPINVYGSLIYKRNCCGRNIEIRTCHRTQENIIWVEMTSGKITY